MEFKLIRKDKIAVITLLLFVILISQSKILNFLFDTALGRFGLIGFILTISYFNKILGVVSVLFAIIMFTNSGLAMREGFDTDHNKIEKINDILKPNPTTSTIVPKHKDDQLRPTPVADKKEEKKVTFKDDAANTGTTEGFCVAEKERRIQQGVNSNAVPTNKNNSDNFLPFEDWKFNNSFSMFQY
jgi:hypothetical protein